MLNGTLRSPHSLELPMIARAMSGASGRVRALRRARHRLCRLSLPARSRAGKTLLFNETSQASADPMRQSRLFWDELAKGTI